MNRLGLLLWKCCDPVYRAVRRFDYEDMGGTNVFRIRVRRFKGPDFRLPNGEELRRGEWVGILHLYNVRLQQLMNGISSENRRSLLMIREAKRSLPELAEFVREHPRGQRVKALIGVTLLNRGVEPLGFHVGSVPDTWWYRFRNWYMLRILSFCHPDGSKRLMRRREALVLKRVILLKDELFRRYGQVEPRLVIDMEQEGTS
ncbi:hypothetical protein OS242_03365 [Tumebacillus sp. DT12]|uniref:YkoP-like domain-containing protein n=1 Tax=Tumebacillus lacus TaxID=2995335 RepID=A0ABT3X079_9BACL|nr:hypothetical protein [Tumebacillus lacus]MCX7569001.1 hypothetical protein [Tumebacillus lacus]